MVMARLHLICGNCGCNDSFEYCHIKEPTDSKEKTLRYVTRIACKNCGTIHDLDENAVNENSII